MIIPAQIVRDLIAAAEQARNLILDAQETGPGERAIARQLGKTIRTAQEFIDRKKAKA